MHTALTAHIEELLPECSNGPTALTNLWRQQAAANQEGQAMLDLLPADSKGSNKESTQGRKQIWACRQHSLRLPMLWRKTGILMAFFFLNAKPEQKLKKPGGSLNTHHSAVLAPKPAPTGPQESQGRKTKQQNPLYINFKPILGEMGQCLMRGRQAKMFHNRPAEQRPPTQSASSRAHTKPQHPMWTQHRHNDVVSNTISGGQGSTTLQTQPRHSSMNLCSYRCHKTNILPSHSSKAQTLSSLLCSHLYLRMEESWRDQKAMVQQPLPSQRTLLPLLVCTQPPPCFLAAVCPACSPSPRANLP